MRQVHSTTFTGPLDLLLQLIEQDEMDISQISLAKVTEEYIAELQKLEELPMDELAEFLVVAAKLLLIKSRLMVPGEVVEDDAGYELERQLKMYQAFIQAAKKLGTLYGRNKVSWPRDGYANFEPIFNPPEKLTPDTMRELYATVLRELEPIIKLPQTVMIRTINIRQKIENIKETMIQQPKTSFHDLLKLAASRTEMIITFLAVLELVKQRNVTVVQDDHFQDIRIESLNPEP